LAEDYAPWSPYNYVLGNPINFTDPDGRSVDGPIYGANGQLVGYYVEPGQGPTQIAKDLNENYGCQLSCEVSYTDVVQSNVGDFENVVNEDGSIQDKNSDDYRSGNIEPGDVLLIGEGIVPADVEGIRSQIAELDQAIDAKSAQITDSHEFYEIHDALSRATRWESGLDPGVKGQQAAHALVNVKHNSDSIRGVRARAKMIKSRDSLAKIIDPQ
jgi:hypothetical protein